METQEKTDNILFDDITHTDTVTQSNIESISKIHAVEISNMTRYLAITSVIVVCFLILLWSRLDINSTKVALGKAQQEYRDALEENRRLQLELNLLLAPASIKSQIAEWDLNENSTVIEIIEE